MAHEAVRGMCIKTDSQNRLQAHALRHTCDSLAAVHPTRSDPGFGAAITLAVATCLWAAVVAGTVLEAAEALPPQRTTGAALPADASGEQIFHAACAACHAPDGKGNIPAGFPRLSGQHPEYVEKQLRAFRAGDRTNDGDQAIMRSVTDKLSDAEIIALANFIAGLN